MANGTYDRSRTSTDGPDGTTWAIERVHISHHARSIFHSQVQVERREGRVGPSPPLSEVTLVDRRVQTRCG